MKSQVDLLVSLLQDAGESLGFNPDRDIVTVRERCRQEGEAFLSIALPRLDDLLLEGLSVGQLPSYEGWLSRCAYPEFLRDLWKGVFSSSGSLRDDPSILSIRWLRQISRFHKKIFEVCEPDRVDDAIERWVQLDADLPSRQEIRLHIDPYARLVSQILFGDLIGEAMSAPFRGQHGPGSVSERHGTNTRWNFDSISYGVESLVGADFFRPNYESLLQRPPSTKMVPARLEAVPKTAVKPRLICIEASYNQYVQQHLMRELKHGMDARGLICAFTRQDYNRQMAMDASISGKLATLDLSDASDRVSMALVEELFGFNPSFLRFLRLSRSAFAQLPDGRTILLKKFASMGSALTFPVEAMVFTALVVASVCRSMNDFRPKTIKALGKRGRGLSVYGDDIILPVDYSFQAASALEAVGLKVNYSKSFFYGNFRESCGMDAYNGNEVTPVYLRRRLPLSLDETAEVTSTVAFRNQMYARYGFNHTVRYLDRLLRSECAIPYVPHGMDGVGLWIDDESRTRSRWNKSLQRMEYRILVPVHQYRDDEANEDGRLLQNLMMNQGSDLGQLHESGLRAAARRFAEAALSPGIEYNLDGRPVASKLHYRYRPLS